MCDTGRPKVQPDDLDITNLLSNLSRGEQDAWEKLAPVVFGQLRGLAESAMRREGAGHTLQPTALVNEAYLRLIGQREVSWQSRRIFFGAAATVMRRILVDYARAKRAGKRGGGARRLDLEDAVIRLDEASGDLLALEESLARFARLDPEKAQIVELRFFAGLSIAQTAAALGVSESSVERAWRIARSWLHRDLTARDGAAGRDSLPTDTVEDGSP